MDKIVIVDAGSQYTHLLFRRILDMGVNAKIIQDANSLQEIDNIKGVVISGGPKSVYKGKKNIYEHIFSLNVPVLGICFGHQYIAYQFGGKVEKGPPEFGKTKLYIHTHDTILSGLKDEEIVWMSHFDEVKDLPPGFSCLAFTENCRYAVIMNKEKKIYGVQFHPEVTHTANGKRILENFVFKIAKCKPNLKEKDIVQYLINEIKEKAQFKNVMCFLSGGVDSTVLFYLLNKALPKKQVVGVMIDHGFLRKNEVEEFMKIMKREGFENVITFNFSNKFIEALNNITDPEQKRVIIGETFLKVKSEIYKTLNLNFNNCILAQGTIYPDTIESGETKHSRKIKTHHNRTKTVKRLLKKNKILEPLRFFYKDEIRELARKLNIPEEIKNKEPFPGPGLAIRCICSDSDVPIKSACVYENKNLSSFIIPIKSVGVQGDFRTYKNLAVIYSKKEEMPKDWKMLESFVSELLKRVDINRIVLMLFKRKKSIENLIIRKSFVSLQRLERLREIDYFVRSFFFNLRRNFWQFPVILFPLSFQSSPQRNESVVLRPVHSKDGMTAEFAKIDFALLKNFVYEFSKKFSDIDFIFYDLSNKPPATIEWE